MVQYMHFYFYVANVFLVSFFSLFFAKRSRLNARAPCRCHPWWYLSEVPETSLLKITRGDISESTRIFHPILAIFKTWTTGQKWSLMLLRNRTECIMHSKAQSGRGWRATREQLTILMGWWSSAIVFYKYPLVLPLTLSQNPAAFQHITTTQIEITGDYRSLPPRNR